VLLLAVGVNPCLGRPLEVGQRSEALDECLGVGLAGSRRILQGMTLTPGTRLGHYRITALIGRGGMGEVYSAYDTKLEREVALKILPETFTQDAERLSRFEREAKMLASLNHPNICTIHDVEEHEGRLFIIMEYVEGRPLAELIAHGRLPFERVISLGVQIVDAIAHAHARLVIHRDLKSRNIVVTPDGRSKVLDFGLATIFRQPPPALAAFSESAVTTVGRSELDQQREVVGTLPYMAPETLRGERADERSDIWAIGVILYEMSTGRLPFKGETVFDLTASILRDSVPQDSEWESRSFQSVVETCLSKEPSHRYRRVTELRAALQALQSATSSPDHRAVRRARPRRRRTEPSKASVAVLPFSNLTADPDQEYFCDGISEDIITGLTKVPGLHVASRVSAFQLKGRGSDLREIRKRLKVSAVLEGSIRRAGDRLRVTATLVSTSDGFQMWSDQFDRDLHDVFAIQDEISRAIVDNLKGKLVRHIDKRLIESHTQSATAYRLYLRGRFQFNTRRPELIKSALENFEQAIVADPTYALAYAGLADTYTILAIHGPYAPTAVFPKAIKAAARALELDDELGAAHASMAFAKAAYEWDWTGAEEHFRRAIDLSPGDSNARHWYGVDCLSPRGRLDEALVELEQAVDLDPLSVSINTSLGGLYHDRREYDRAIEQYLSTIELEPTFYFSHWNLGRTYEQVREYGKAMESFQRALELAPGAPQVLSYLARCHALTGREDEARRVLDQLLELRTTRYVNAVAPAIVYLALADYDRAFQFLEQACQERTIWLIWTRVAPIYDVIRQDPRYFALLKKIGLT
jgi:serine/threonine protein kinase/tetratricopeptide (TPR) repeat protein